MFTDIDEWDLISTKEPEKVEWFENCCAFECGSVWDFIERFDGEFHKFESIEDTIKELVKLEYEGKLK